VVEGKKVSFAAEVVRVLKEHYSQPAPAAMNRKRARLADTREREYILYDEEGIKTSLEPLRLPEKFDVATINPATLEERKQKQAHNTWRSFHNVQLDYGLGPKECMVRRWPCWCRACEEQTRATTVKARYAENVNCELRPVFGKHNSWRKVTMEMTTDGDGVDEDPEALYASYVNDVRARLREIADGDYGALATDDLARTPGYYIIIFRSGVYTLEEDTQTDDYGTLEAGASVIDFEWLNPCFGKERIPQ
jgi:hypothetical protein